MSSLNNNQKESESPNYYVHDLESRLKQRSDDLEEVHFDAAMDAQISMVKSRDYNPSNNSNEPSSNNNKDQKEEEGVLFSDYCNHNAVHNCLSPYVPSASERIDYVFRILKLNDINDDNDDDDDNDDEVLLDIGCGDGRVCISACKSQKRVKRAIGIDVSPPCIEMARQIAIEEGLSSSSCTFHEFDCTLDADSIVLSDNSVEKNTITTTSSSLSTQYPEINKDLQSATIIFMYIYPTLLDRLIPLLSKLCRLKREKNKRSLKIITLTYHLPDEIGVVEHFDKHHDVKIYSNVL